MQLAVLGLLAIGLVNGAFVIFSLPDYFQAVINASIDRQVRLYPNIDPAQVGQLRQMAGTIFTFSLIVGAVVEVAYLIIATLGTLRRWTWWFWVQLVLAGLAVLAVPQSAWTSTRSGSRPLRSISRSTVCPSDPASGPGAPACLRASSSRSRRAATSLT